MLPILFIKKKRKKTMTLYIVARTSIVKKGMFK